MFAAHKTRHFTLTTVLCVFIFTPPPPRPGELGGWVGECSKHIFLHPRALLVAWLSMHLRLLRQLLSSFFGHDGGSIIRDPCGFG
jgi:hypothetical protein